MKKNKLRIPILLLGACLYLSPVSQAHAASENIATRDVQTKSLTDLIKEHNKGYSEVKSGKVLGYNKSTKLNEQVDIENIISNYAGDIRLPLDEKHYKRSSGFGLRRDPIYKTKEDIKSLPIHTGLDLATSDIEGANIYSVLDGEIRVIDRSTTSYGNLVIVNHGEIETYYAHLKDFKKDIKVGDRVKAGDLIGFVGTTGRSTGPHLHIEFNVGQIAIDPKVFLNMTQLDKIENKEEITSEINKKLPEVIDSNSKDKNFEYMELENILKENELLVEPNDKRDYLEYDLIPIEIDDYLKLTSGTDDYKIESVKKTDFNILPLDFK